MADPAREPEICGDPRFFGVAGPFAARVVAEAAGAEPVADAGRLLTGVAPLRSAGPDHVSFIDNRRYLGALAATAAGAVIVHPDLRGKVPPDTLALVTSEPYVGWARVAALFHPEPATAPGVHQTALVDPTASIDPLAGVGPFAMVGAHVVIGAGSRVGAHAAIGAGVAIGPDCRIESHVSISHALLGARVVVFPGARIGQDGFGFASTKDGHVSVPQLGRVVVEDDVWIGANTTVDRGSAQDTVIGAGSRLDNLVMIGHNVRLGRCCVIVAQVGIAGSTVLEDFVIVGGQAGFTGHLRIGRGARISAQAGVLNDLAAGASVAGSPAIPARDKYRQIAAIRRLAAYPAALRPGAEVAE